MWYKGNKILILAVIILFITFMLLGTYIFEADGYVIEFTPWIWTSTPLICVWDSDYNKNASEAILLWDEKLRDISEGFALDGVIVSGHTPPELLELCDIHVIYVEMEFSTYEERNNGIHGAMTGMTHWSPFRKAVYLFVYEGRDNIYTSLQQFDDAMTTTTMHELGHAFGLNHMKPESNIEAMKPWPQSLMWPWAGNWYHKTIDEATLLAFQCRYAGDSWDANNIGGCDEFKVDTSSLTWVDKVTIKLDL